MSASLSAGDASPADYHLIYFNTRGRAEVIRLLFTIAKVPFQDERIPHPSGANANSDWISKKSDRQLFPFSQIPVLRLADGCTLAQSHSIARFLSKRFGFLGKNDVEAAQIESLVDQILDIRQALMEARGKKDDGIALGKFLSTDLGNLLQLFEQWLERRKSATTPYFVGDTLSYADVAMYYFLWILQNGKEDENKPVVEALKNAPKVKAVAEAVANLPQVQEYVAKRQPTPW